MNMINDDMKRGVFKSSIDNSRLSDYEACPQLYEFKYVLELGEDDGNHAANFSTFMIHKPIEEWFISGGTYKPNWQELMKQWSPSSTDMFNDKTNAYTVKRAERAFNEHANLCSEQGILDEYEFVESEIYVTKDLWPEQAENQFSWGSKTDIILRHKKSGKRVPWEIKASKYDYITYGLDWNRQVLGEIFVNHAEMGFVELITLTAKQNESSISIFEIMPDHEDMDEWVQATRMSMENFIVSRETNFYPRKAIACKRFNQICQFYDICCLGGSKHPAAQKAIKALPKRDSLKYLLPN
jgi:hypothetical protein